MLKKIPLPLFFALGTLSLAGISHNGNNAYAVNLTNPNHQLTNQPTKTNLLAQNNPYSRLGYKATAFFKCSVGNANHDKQCPGGINRGKNGSASITVLFPNNYEVKYDFKDGDVTTTFEGDLTWGKQDDDWYIGIDNNLFIIIPDAAVYGG